MRVERRYQVIGLGVLALLTIVLSLVALGQARAGRPVAATPATPLPTPTSGPATATRTPSPTPTPDGTATPTASGTPSAASEPPLPEGLAGLKALLKRDAGGSVLVFGDGSGDEPDEWVRRWAVGQVGDSAPVTYRSWNRDTEKWRGADPDGGEDAITIWNASRRAPDLDAEPGRVAKASRPADVVLLSYGHRKTADAVVDALTAIHKAVRAENPDATVIVMLQNPDPIESQYLQQETVEQVRKWAKAAGLDTVNIHDAFLADPTPRADLVEADGSPTPTGSELWARTLQAAIDAAK